MQNDTIRIWFSHAVAWYLRYERHINIGGFVLGFLADTFIFTNADLSVSYAVLTAHLCIVGGGIFLMNLREKRVTEGKEFSEYVEPWIPFVIQFSSGSLLSGFAILYTKSAAWVENWPFLLLIVALLLGNEFFRKRYLQFAFQVSMFFFVLLSYCIVLVPFVLRELEVWTFVLSGAIAVSLIMLFLYVLRRIAPARFREGQKIIFTSIPLIFAFVNVLYFTNSIPPVPLSLKELSVYHDVQRVGSDYLVTYEPESWQDKLFGRHVAHLIQGDPVFVFSSVFSPASLDINITHVWERLDQGSGRWLQSGTVTFPLRGGRAGGYRGYSEKLNPVAGIWRVSVENARGQLLGRVQFTVATTTIEAAVATSTR